MRVLRVIGKAFLFPFMIIGTIIQWIGTLLLAVSSAILRLGVGIVILVTGISFILGIVPGSEALKIGAIVIAVFMISLIGKTGLALVTVLNEKIRDYIFL